MIRDIFVVDNGSSPQQIALLRNRCAAGGFTLVEIGVNRFFGEGNNIGVDFARTDYIVFLNNDAFVQPGWIEALASTMRSDPDVAAVGPMFLYPDGRVQEVGGIALPTGDAVQIGKGAIWGPDHYDTPCVVDYCSAACLMMRRSDFLKVGGFGFEWEPAYYEDTDLCLKLWTQCGKVVVNPQARVVHIESKTTSDSRLQLQDISEINRIRFVKKWGAWLEARQTAPLADLERAPRSVLDELDAADLDSWTTPPASSEPQFVLYSPTSWSREAVSGCCSRRRSHLSELFGTRQRGFATPQRYSAIRISRSQRSSASNMSWACRRPGTRWRRTSAGSLFVIGNSSCRPCRPSAIAACTTSNSRSGPPTRMSRVRPVAGRIRRDLGVLGVRPPSHERPRASLRAGGTSRSAIPPPRDLVRCDRLDSPGRTGGPS